MTSAADATADAGGSGRGDEPSARPRHPIGVVARRTGLKPDLIRAWERRYHAVEPSRSDTRRRLYSDTDVERLRLLRQVVSAGHGIRHVARLPEAELLELIAGDDPQALAETRETDAGTAGEAQPDPARPASSRPVLERPDPVANAFLAACLEAIQRLQGQELEALLERAVVALGRIELVEQLAVPLLQRIGDLWKDGTLRPIHEHLATAVTRTFVGRLYNVATPATAPVIVVTTPIHQYHEMGSLMAAACAAAEGWQVTYLGPNLPAEEIAAAAQKKNARVLALGITYPPDDPILGQELELLGRLMPAKTLVIAGGRVAEAYRPQLERLPARILPHLAAFRRELELLRHPPQTPHR